MRQQNNVRSPMRANIQAYHAESCDTIGGALRRARIRLAIKRMVMIGIVTLLVIAAIVMVATGWATNWLQWLADHFL